jgi:hypothetical protein
VHLALLPQWEDTNASLRAAPKQSKHLIYWIASTTVSLAVGALVAASLMTVRPGDYTQILPRAHSETVVATQGFEAAAPVAAAASVPSQVVEAEQPTELAAEAVAPVQVPVVIAELTVTSVKATKPAKRGKLTVARKASKRGVQSARTELAAQPEPSVEAEAEVASSAESSPSALVTSEAETQTVEATETAPAPEPEAPALPEMLTRDQVRGGLEALRAQVLACTNGMYGKVLADVTISAPGRVSKAVIEGTFADTNAASCMARTLRNAQFPAFAGADISVRYPFSF